MELGASIFVKPNKNMWRATEEFGLERYDFEDEDGSTGIWDGSQFVLTVGQSRVGSWWDSVKVLWRYGYHAPTRTKKIVQEMIDRFNTLYLPSFFAPFGTIGEVSRMLGWLDLTAQTGAEYLDAQGINRLWTREMIEAATRVNYGQNVTDIHALETLASLAATGASSVKGGNFQIFENFIKRSNATTHLNTTVSSISRDASTSLWTVKSTHASSVIPETKLYRAVILAAPFHQTGIKFSSPSLAEVPEQPYVNLHVTLLSTTSLSPNPEYFGLPKGSVVPSMVLTTWEGARNGGRAPEFNSLSYHGKVKRRDGEPREVEEHLVKIFSQKKIEDEWLQNMFNGQVGWVYRKVFQAYPVLPPTTSFPPIKLDAGLYYVNAFEPMISTMETETISSRNAVQLFFQDTFNLPICNYNSSTQPTEASWRETDVLGWDC
ncbi:hypothetical protein K474DRAFT_1666124 [Panus rudis PR-1116 ss-1]|nr:hypothetical protein K474DRAFT_1666124 [Panus rudis PR-1116 ss-1]